MGPSLAAENQRVRYNVSQIRHRGTLQLSAGLLRNEVIKGG